VSLTIKDDLRVDAARAAQDGESEVAFRRSLRASRERRARAARGRRWMLRRRTSIVLTALATTGLAGGAFAHQTAGGGATARTSAGMLQKGSRGAAVRTLQLKLGIAADGVYGPQTRRAVTAFQRRNGLSADGIAGPVTLRALGLTRLPASDAARAASVGVSTSTAATLQRIATCESGGNPRAISANGRYRGKYQFDRATWRAYGGSGGDPANASEAEQDRVAAKLLAARGTSPWPVCGRK
jgi:peptidoglycan hydrolase-like protein with peptidoglycan-binding domain